MADNTVWKKGAGWLALLAVASFAAPAREADFSMPDSDPRVLIDVNPTDYRNLDGVWQCRFLQSKGDIQRDYYSIWTFDAAKKEVVMMWSPVHKGLSYAYRWDGKQLVLDHHWDPPRPTFGTFKTQMQVGGTLVIEMPQLRWKGWYCHHQPAERWPADGLQFLDYSRYPWLSGLVEDGWEIEKYRNPKLYEEWRKGPPR